MYLRFFIIKTIRTLRGGYVTSKKALFIAAFCSVIALSSCASYTQLGGASGAATGAAAGATAQDANPRLERCEKPLGTLAIAEDTNAVWYRLLT